MLHANDSESSQAISRYSNQPQTATEGDSVVVPAFQSCMNYHIGATPQKIVLSQLRTPFLLKFIFRSHQCEGFQHAYESVSREFRNAAQTMVAVPLEEYSKSGASAYLRAFLKAMPVAILRPAIGEQLCLSCYCASFA